MGVRVGNSLKLYLRAETVPARWQACPTGWAGGLPGRGAGTWTRALGWIRKSRGQRVTRGGPQARVSPAVLVHETSVKRV